MTMRQKSRTLFLVAAVLLLAAAPATAQSLAFTQAAYTAEQGETLTLITVFSAPVPNGLQGYSLRLSFPVGILALAPTDISVPAALNFDLFGPPAAREVGAGQAAVSGFIDFGAPAYTGTAFAVFSVTIPAGAPVGVHTLRLDPHLPGGNSFVDGLDNGIDTALVFGTAQLTITASAEPPPSDPILPEPVLITREPGGLRVRWEGRGGQVYTLLRSTNLTSWQPIQSFSPAADGPIEYLDTTPLPVGGRFFYQVGLP